VVRGLTPLRRRGITGVAAPLARIVRVWTETWVPHEQRLQELEAALRARGAVVLSGGDFDRWDCEVRGGMLGATRLRLLVEEHGQGRQLARFKVWPHCPPRPLFCVGLLAAVAWAATMDRAWVPALVFAGMGLFVASRALYECGAALATVLAILSPPRKADDRRAAASATAPAAAVDEELDEVTLAGGAP
jgi:hypothetical protein